MNGAESIVMLFSRNSRSLLVNIFLNIVFFRALGQLEIGMRRLMAADGRWWRAFLVGEIFPRAEFLPKAFLSTVSSSRTNVLQEVGGLRLRNSRCPGNVGRGNLLR